jgi:hypothetical protein
VRELLDALVRDGRVAVDAGAAELALMAGLPAARRPPG